jgi:hypothetical protein
MGNMKNDGERLKINSMDGDINGEMLDKYFSAEADLIDASNNELDFSERSLPNYMRNTKSREMQISEAMKISKSTYKLMSPQGMAEFKKPSAATLMSSASVMSLGNRMRMGTESRRILSPTEQHSNNMILGPPKAIQTE